MDDPILISAILFVGLAFKFAGFAIRDELWLRILVTIGLACDVVFYTFRPEPVFQSIVANVLLVSINLLLVVLIVMERTTWRMSAEDREVFSYFPTLTPGQFRRLRRLMRRDTVEAGTPLLIEGKPVEHLMLVFSERIEIAKDGTAFPISGPAFVGEIALLTGNASSAGVSLPEGGTVLRLPIEALRARMDRSPPLSNAMIALFGQELARKVADSVPMDRAAASRPVPTAPEIVPVEHGDPAADLAPGRGG